MNVSLYSTASDALEDLLRQCGARVNSIDANQLAMLANTSARQPDAIIIDRRDRAAIPPALAALRREHPSTGVVMVLPNLDAAMMLEAMRAGVTECVTEPLKLEDFQAALARIAAQRPKSRSTGEVYAIVGAKGGVGATTVAVNSATMLNKLRPSSTLLIDLHLSYGDAGVFLGAEPRFSIVDAFENISRMDATLFRSLLTRTKFGLHLLASSDRPISTAVSTTHVRSLIEVAASEFQYVILDVPRSDSAILDALDATSTITIIANQELATVRSAGRMVPVIEGRYGAQRLSVAITRYTEDSEIGQKDVERVVNRPVTYLFPNNYPAALASLTKGHPLVLDNDSKLASALTGFARALAGMPDEAQEQQQRSTGFLSLLAGGRKR